MSFASEFANGIQIARENYEREQSRKLSEKHQNAQEQLAQKNFDLQSFMASLNAAQQQAAAQSGKIHETSDGGTVSAPAESSTAKGGMFEVSGGVPQITPPSPIKVSGRPELGISDVLLPVQSYEEVQRNKTSERKAAQQDALDLFEKEQGIRDKNENITVSADSPLIKFGLKAGTYKPTEITAYTNLQNAAEARAARIAASTEAALARKDARAALQVQRDASRAGGLRDDYNKETAIKQYATIVPQLRIIRQAQANPSAAGDLALIFSYMKIVDPQSTVREGEFATAQNSGSIPEKVQALYNKVINGTRLATSQRADFVSTASRILDGYERQKNAADELYGTRAQAEDIDPMLVISPDADFGIDIPKQQTPAVTGKTPSGVSFSFQQ